MQNTPSEAPDSPAEAPDSSPEVPDPSAEAPDVPAGAPARAGRSSRDMIISMVVLLIPVVLLVALFRFFGGEDVVTTDTQPAFDAARAASAFPVSEPENLAAGWRSIRSAFGDEEGGKVLRVGYVTPNDGTVQLVESGQPADAVLQRELGPSPTHSGTVPAGGRDWQAYTTARGERALVLLEARRTIVIVGSAGQDELAELAAAL